MNEISLSQENFAQHRKNFLDKMVENSVAIIPSAPECFRNNDSTFLFRQDSDFYYLTGFNEPDAVIVLIKGRKQGEYILFNRERCSDKEKWTGVRVGQEGAVENYLADEAYPIKELEKRMSSFLEAKTILYYTMGRYLQFDKKISYWIKKLKAKIRQGKHAPQRIVDLGLLLHEDRLFKSQDEIALMQKAANISIEAHQRAMKMCRPGMMEYELEAELLYTFRSHGSKAPAYNSIVAGGKNACTLHYEENNNVLSDGECILVDAGAEYHFYASDITRTFPVNGKFSAEQKAVYQVVLNAQKAAIEKIVPGTPFDHIQQVVIQVLTEGLIDLGILEGAVEDLIKSEAYKPFYMHSASHWIGMDVHDVGEYNKGKTWRNLEENMVLTIEPGLYISPASNVDEKWWNIGVRIEDDIVVTKEGNLNLTAALIKEVDEIEAWMSQ